MIKNEMLVERRLDYPRQALASITAAVGVFAITIMVGCVSSPQNSPIAPSEIVLDVVVEDPESLGWSQEGLDSIRREVEALGSAAVMIVTRGQVVFSHGDVRRNYRAHSIRKSLLSALYGMAIENGSIDPTRTLAELGIDDQTPLSETEQRATVAHLLAARSGVYLPAASEVAAMRESRPKRHAHEPGTFWYYNNWDFNVLGTIYRQQTDEDIFEAFERNIARPIGMQDYDLRHTRYQREEISVHPSYKFRMSTRDLARFGLLFLNRGFWADEPVIPADWIEESTRVHSITGNQGTKSGYGLMWWAVATWDDLLKDSPLKGAYTASGTGGHRLTVIPEIDTVVVHRVDTDERQAPRIGSSRYDRFLMSVVHARLIIGSN